MFLGTSETLAPTRISLPTHRFPLEVGMTGNRTQEGLTLKTKSSFHCAIGGAFAAQRYWFLRFLDI